jgi:hypothetical protein
MKECKIVGCSETTLVYSGVDAFMFGNIPTERYCYKCANVYAQIKDSVDRITAYATDMAETPNA